MAPNVPALFDAHFGVAMAGGVLNALNVRLDADTIAFILDHGEAKVLITDREFSPTIKAALAKRSEEHTSELQSLMRISYAVFCLKKKKKHSNNKTYRLIKKNK